MNSAGDSVEDLAAVPEVLAATEALLAGKVAPASAAGRRADPADLAVVDPVGRAAVGLAAASGDAAAPIPDAAGLTGREAPDPRGARAAVSRFRSSGAPAPARSQTLLWLSLP